MKSSGSFCALMFFAFGVTAHAASFEYRLTQYPASSGDCHEVAHDLGMRLTMLSGITLTRAFCADISQSGYDLRFQYTSDQELPLVTTSNPHEGPSAQGGIYATPADCAAALPAERARFETATGLTAFVAYCQIDAFSPRPYAIHLDAFGDPAIRPRVEYQDTAGEPIGVTAAQLETQISERIQQQGVNASYVRYKPLSGSGYATISLLYYADARLPLITDNQVRLHTQSECIATLANLRPVYDAQTPQPLAVYCAYRDGYRTYDIVTLWLGQKSLLPQNSAERFARQRSCEDARSGLVERYRTRDGLQVEASACSYNYETTEWRVVMLIAP